MKPGPGKSLPWVVALLAMLSWAMARPAVAAAEKSWRKDTRLLPSYCAYRANVGKIGGVERYPLLKGIWVHIHHYCDGLYSTFQARTELDARNKKDWLARAARNFHYVSRYCRPSGCVIYPELHTFWGWVLGEQGDIQGAVSHLEKAIKAKPDYARAYAELASLYKRTGSVEQARRVLKQGLRRNPDSRRLKRLLKSLD